MSDHWVGAGEGDDGGDGFGSSQVASPDVRRGLGTALVAAIAWFAPGLAAAGAGTERATPCRFTAEFDMVPGLSLTPASGTFTSGGETGAITCSGPVDGRTVTGPGTFGADGSYGTIDGDSCVSGGEGSATQSFTLPAGDGPVPVRNAITFTYQPVPGVPGAAAAPPVASGRFEGRRFSGTFDVTVIQGDCVTSPVTRVRLDGRGMVRSPRS
jgi:hypothetical protein